MSTSGTDGKMAASQAAVELVRDGMRLGLGTGSTAACFIRLVGDFVKRGFRVEAVATSQASEALARELGIPILPFDQAGELDLTVDGADEVDPQLALIKGGGGALLREKIVAYHSRRMVVIADRGKRVERLGRFPLPVEIIPFWWEATHRAIAKLGVAPVLRQRERRPFVTDNGNFILDCPFGAIDDPAALQRRLAAIPGVVESGLFVGMAERALFGSEAGVEVLLRK
jgi:ribose 5-phosphate isomerase A